MGRSEPSPVHQGTRAPFSRWRSWKLQRPDYGTGHPDTLSVDVAHGLVLLPTVFDRNITALDESGFDQSVVKRIGLKTKSLG